MIDRHTWLIACAALLGWNSMAYADAPPPATEQTQAAVAGQAAPSGPPTLAQALLQASPSDTDVALAVGADAVPGSASTPLLDPDTRAPLVAAAYGYLAQDFHGVTAIAPPTMTVFNADPGKPNPFDGMPPTDSFKMLLGSLDEGQWKLITGKVGIGVSDLTTDDQKNLFLAIFPIDSVLLAPRTGGLTGGDTSSSPKLTADDLQRAKLRIGQRVRMGLPIEGKDNSSLIADAPSNGELNYTAMNITGNDDGVTKLYGVPLRATVPNTPKESDLDYDAAPLTAAIDLTGIKTVGDLVTRIGVATHIELYADRRYEKQNVLLRGPSTARARDLLQALALCVRGTYRKIGPAYVLTNARIGAGASQVTLIRFAQTAEMARKNAIDAAGDRAYQTQKGLDNNQFDEGLSMTDDQKTQARKQSGDYPGNDITFTAPLDQLTPSQQALAKDLIQKWNANVQINGGNSTPMRLTASRPLSLWLNTTVVMSTPAIPGPIVLDDYLGRTGLLKPSTKLINELNQKRSAETPEATPATDVKPPPSPAPPKPNFAAIFAPFPVRGVIARPQTVADLNKMIDQMHAIGFNQLWLDVFSSGQSHLDDKPNLFAAARAKAKGMGITVLPMITPLNWGSNAPADLQDLTMSGENSAQAAAWRQRFEKVAYQGMSPEEADKQPQPTDLYVDPASSAVSRTLVSFVSRLASTPNIPTIVVSGQMPPGYSLASGDNDTGSGYILGYTEAARLAFLRANHVDPIDLDGEVYINSPVNQWRIPEFHDWEVQSAVSVKWNEYRTQIATNFLKNLLAAAQSSAGQSTGLMVCSQGASWVQGWYGLWRNPAAPIPHATKHSWEEGTPAAVEQEARAQTTTAIAILPIWGFQTRQAMADTIKNIGAGWNGFVIDLNSPESDVDALDHLEKSLTAKD
ncbi:hypothetical protein CCAX7_18920 [Capsulimonas corticalis]|uniref:Uncharacterized protein n=1 Tax=Capsulimonas corticalis TaxID=2219043 RepID=A0A402D5J4_9BACT|nr:hypothetical protein [Capsulimonas corticalis]BDI29841.1 hypothetical protein CCAX7_18920 [Capsulimonas corticalis]